LAPLINLQSPEVTRIVIAMMLETFNTIESSSDPGIFGAALEKGCIARA
jgi:hypothetical protein